MQTCGVIGREFCAAGKRAEVVVQRHPTILDVLLGVGELVLGLVLVEQHRNVVVPGQGVARSLFMLLTECKLSILLDILILLYLY